MLSRMKYAPGVVKDDTKYSSLGYATDSDKIRFVRGRVESLGGYQDATLGETLDGVCRGLHAWVDNVGYKYMAAGTHTKLYVEKDGTVYDITPVKPVEFAAIDGYGAEAGISDMDHGAKNGDTVYLYSAGQVGDSGTLPTDCVFIGEGTSIATVSKAGHGFLSGSIITISGAVAAAGIDVNGTWTIHVTDDDTFIIDVGTKAVGTGFIGGAAMAYKQYEEFKVRYNDFTSYYITLPSPSVFPSQAVEIIYEMSIGNVDGKAPGGYSYDAYSTGTFGYTPDPVNKADYLPRTWSLDNIGQSLIASPLGGGIYIWNLGLSTRATIIPNAPTQNDSVIVTAEGCIMALGTINTDGDYDPLAIRNSDIRGNGVGAPYENWTPGPTSYSDDVSIGVGSTIIGAVKTKAGIAIWTDSALHFATYVGSSTQTYRYDHIATGCGLAGPNAAIEKDGSVFWYTPDVGFYSYSSGSPEVMPCPVRQFVVDALAADQAFKVYAAYDAVYNGVYWFYPTASKEVDRYVRVDLSQMVDQNSGWSVGTTDMTAWLDRNPLKYPRSVRIDGLICDQERGRSANGASISRHIEYSPMEFSGDEAPHGTRILNFSRVIFDAKIEGDVELSVLYRRFPNGPLTVKGPYTMDASTQYTKARGQGRQAGFLWQSFGTEDSWRFGDIRYDVTDGGRR